MALHLGVAVGGSSPDREGTFYSSAPAALPSDGSYQTDQRLTCSSFQSNFRPESRHSGTEIDLFRQQSANSHFQHPNHGYGSIQYSRHYSEFPAAEQGVTSFSEPGRDQVLGASFSHTLPILPPQIAVLGFGDRRRPELNQHGHHQAFVPTGNGNIVTQPSSLAWPIPYRPQISQACGSVPPNDHNSGSNNVGHLDFNFRQTSNVHAATTPLSGHQQMPTLYNQAVVSSTGARRPDLTLRPIEQPLVVWTNKATHSRRGPYKKSIPDNKSSNGPSQPTLPPAEVSSAIAAVETIISSLNEEAFDFKCVFKSCPQSTQVIKRIDGLRAHFRNTHRLDTTEIAKLIAEAIRTASKDILESDDIEVVRREALKLREEKRLAYAEVASSKMGQSTKTECGRIIDNRKCGKTFPLKVIQEQPYDKFTNKAICHGCAKADNDSKSLDSIGHKFLAINGHYSSDWFKVYESYRTYEVEIGSDGEPKVPDFACLLVARMVEVADGESTSINFLQPTSPESQYSASQEPIVSSIDSSIETAEQLQAITKTSREFQLEAKIKALEGQLAWFAKTAAGSQNNPVNIEDAQPSTSPQGVQSPIQTLTPSVECSALHDAFFGQLEQESSQDVAISVSHQTAAAKRKSPSDDIGSSKADQEPADNRKGRSPSKKQSPSKGVKFLREVAPESKKLKKDKNIHNHNHKEAKEGRTKFRHVPNRVAPNEIKHINNAASLAVGKNQKYSWMDSAKKPPLPRDYAHESSKSHSSSPENINASYGGSSSSLADLTVNGKTTKIVEESIVIDNSDGDMQEEFEVEQDDLFTDVDQSLDGWFELSDNDDQDGRLEVECSNNACVIEEVGSAHEDELRDVLEMAFEEALAAGYGQADLVEDTEMVVGEDYDSEVSEEE